MNEFRRREVPSLHLITDDEILQAAEFTDRAEALIRAGGADVALHVRARSLPARTVFELAGRLYPIAAEHAALLIVNDRVDVASAIGAHGVQLGARSLPLSVARRLLGPEPLLGASIHSLEEARAAARDGADFLLAGTLFATPSHPGRPGAGPDWLGSLRDIPLPLIGIGGITSARVETVCAAGAHGVAVMRSVWHAVDPVRALHAFAAALRSGSAGVPARQ